MEITRGDSSGRLTNFNTEMFKKNRPIKWWKPNRISTSRCWWWWDCKFLIKSRFFVSLLVRGQKIETLNFTTSSVAIDWPTVSFFLGWKIQIKRIESDRLIPRDARLRCDGGNFFIFDTWLIKRHSRRLHALPPPSLMMMRAVLSAGDRIVKSINSQHRSGDRRQILHKLTGRWLKSGLRIGRGDFD